MFDNIFIIISTQAMPEIKRRTSSKRSKYAKIPIKIKVKFLRKVLLEGFSIRDVTLIIGSHP
jgi:hypothetical protein